MSISPASSLDTSPASEGPAPAASASEIASGRDDARVRDDASGRGAAIVAAFPPVPAPSHGGARPAPSPATSSLATSGLATSGNAPAPSGANADARGDLRNVIALPPRGSRSGRGAARVAVIGAGITGVTTAYALVRRGLDVTLIDRQARPAMETSYANGGQLSASNAEVWTHPGTILKGMKWMLRADAPLLVHPLPTWSKLSWMAEFVANCRHYERNTIRTVELAIASRAHMERIAAEEGIEYDREERGILHVYRTRAAFEHARRVNDLYRRGGLERHAVTPDEMGAIEPALSGPFFGGFHTPSDATGDIHKFTRGLAAAAERRGMRFVGRAAVTATRAVEGGVEIAWEHPDGPASERFDACVVCAGVGSRRIARQLGDRVPIYPVKGYSITVHLDDAASRDAAPWVSLLDDDAKIVTSRLGADRFRVAGTAEFAGENRDIRMARIKPLVDWTERLFPGIDTARTVPWAGLRPMTPSMMPRVGAGRRPGVFYNTGHGHLGWTLGAITAEMAAEAVASKHGGERVEAEWLEAAE